MKAHRVEREFAIALLAAALFASGASAWAAAGNCVYDNSGSGIGGTGTLARGTGIGGTGAAPDPIVAPLKVAGNVIAIEGNAEAQSNGRSRPLAKGDAVCVGETITTLPQGALQLRMADAGSVALQAGTRLRIDKFVFNGTAKDASLFTLLNGSSRIVTGKIGKRNPQNDLVATPNATIGVLGTDHEATVILPGDARGLAAGTYDKVNSGVTYIQNAAGRVEIHPEQAGFAASVEAMPLLLHDLPDFHETALQQSGEAHAAEAGGEPEAHAHHGHEGVLEHHELPSLPEVEAIERPEPPEVLETPEPHRPGH